jgi:circadian clock protein KaiB
MPKKKTRSGTARRSKKLEYILRIFVAGRSSRSRKVAENLKSLCEEAFPGRYKVKILDISKYPKLAVEHNVIAVPTVIRALPAPIRKFVGTFADENGARMTIDLASNFKP